MRAQRERMADPEAARGRAMMSMPVVNVAPPVVNVAPTAVSVTVNVDGEVVAAAVERSMARDSRTTGSSFDHDGRMGFAGPDVRD